MKKLFSPWWLLVIAALGTGVLAWVYWGSWNIHHHANAGELGQLGDFFGGLLNPLVSILTLFVAISVWRLQKDELELTRNELAQTKLALEEQAKTAEQQRQEQRFFDFLNIYRSTVDSIQFEMESNTGSVISLQGKRAFRLLTTDQSGNPMRELSQYFSNGEWDRYFARDLSGLKAEIWDSTSPVLDHYFRAIFSILRESEPTLGEDCWRYTKLLRAQLSRDEVNLIAMNLLYDEEGKKMRKLVARYGILKHMPASHLRTFVEDELVPSSFGRKWAETHSTPNQSSAC